MLRSRLATSFYRLNLKARGRQTWASLNGPSTAVVLALITSTDKYLADCGAQKNGGLAVAVDIDPISKKLKAAVATTSQF